MSWTSEYKFEDKEYESDDGSEYDIADECEGCNMDDDDLYEIAPVKMVGIFANEYGPYDRKFGKGMLRNNDSLLANLDDTFDTFQKVITSPAVEAGLVKPEVVKPAKKPVYHFADGTPVDGTPFHTVEREYVNKDGVTVVELPTTAKDIENMRRIIAEVKNRKLK